MKKLSFPKLAERVLSEECHPLTPEEIWETATRKGYDKETNSSGKTPIASLSASLYVQLQKNPDSPFYIAEQKPTRFYLKGSMTAAPIIDEVATIDNIPLVDDAPTKEPTAKPAPTFKEIGLHPFLTYFAYAHFKVYTKTVDHTKSVKKDYGQWIHPDIVGCYFPLEDWQTEVFDLSVAVGATSLHLYSFELKLELGINNLRESFFQTVSNSSWANEAYLVAAKISHSEDFLNELRRLSSSFGIGVIALDVLQPKLSKVLFPATRKEALDWDMLNKLAAMNPDFREFLKRVKNDVRNSEIRKEWFDTVYTPDRLVVQLNK